LQEIYPKEIGANFSMKIIWRKLITKKFPAIFFGKKCSRKNFHKMNYEKFPQIFLWLY